MKSASRFPAWLTVVLLAATLVACNSGNSEPTPRPAGTHQPSTSPTAEASGSPTPTAEPEVLPPLTPFGPELAAKLQSIKDKVAEIRGLPVPDLAQEGVARPEDVLQNNLDFFANISDEDKRDSEAWLQALRMLQLVPETYTLENFAENYSSGIAGFYSTENDALVLIGEGEAFVNGARLPGGEALKRASISPLALAAKEGLALINGTQASTAVLALALLDASTLAQRPENPRTLHNVGPETFTSRAVVTGLSDPWEVVWGPDGHLWITERTGFRVTRVDPSSGSTRVALTLDDVYQSVVQDGLLGLALHPDLLKNAGRDWAYLAYTYDRDPGPGVTRRVRVRRYTYHASQQTLGAPLDILDDMPAHDDHGAGRVLVGPDGKLYFTRGDLGGNFLANFCNPIRSQDLPGAKEIAARDWSTYQGKVLRMELVLELATSEADARRRREEEREAARVALPVVRRRERRLRHRGREVQHLRHVASVVLRVDGTARHAEALEPLRARRDHRGRHDGEEARQQRVLVRVDDVGEPDLLVVLELGMLLEIGDVDATERAQIERRMAEGSRHRAVEEFLAEAGEMLSGLSRCAGIVLVEKQSKALKQVEFVHLGPGKALAVLVSHDGDVENRIVALPEGLPLSSLNEASNYLNARIAGLTLAEARAKIEAEIEARRGELDKLTARVVTDGLATWSGSSGEQKSLIVCGRSHLLEDVKAMEDLERVRLLFEDLDTKKDLIHLLGLAEGAEGVRIFIGSENKLFSLSGSSLIVSPFEDTEHRIVGVLGVIGPTRLNYARIIPMVDYTARLLGRLVP